MSSHYIGAFFPNTLGRDVYSITSPPPPSRSKKDGNLTFDKNLKTGKNFEGVTGEKGKRKTGKKEKKEKT